MTGHMPFQNALAEETTPAFGAAKAPGIICVAFHVEGKITPGCVFLVTDSAVMKDFFLFAVRLHMGYKVTLGRKWFVTDTTDIRITTGVFPTDMAALIV